MELDPEVCSQETYLLNNRKTPIGSTEDEVEVELVPGESRWETYLFKIGRLLIKGSLRQKHFIALGVAEASIE